MSGSGGNGPIKNSRLFDQARKVRNRPFVDNRWLSLSGLPNLRQVSTGQAGQETGYHTPSERMPQRHANRPMGWAGNRSEPLPLAGVDKSTERRQRAMRHGRGVTAVL
jgi:hypothetical protein